MPNHVSLPDSLESLRIMGLPPAAYYISDFITSDEEQMILDRIASAPKPRWKQLTHRRLQTWPSDLVNNKLIDAPLPAWLEEPIVSRLTSLRLGPASESSNIFGHSPHLKPNHVLINEYPAGVGIMPHKDGAAYHPVVCTVSLGASICLDIHKTKDDGTLDQAPAWRILQEPRSLLITTSDLYTGYLHGIADITEDVELSDDTVANWTLLRSGASFQEGRNVRQTRTSLTYRDVMNVSKLGSKLGMFRKK
ncbi:Uu.00g057720.m01.CDS01 [Anthostomella pinea]|uniref:Uu.00g057720.m01.CDS01 n=1 Tax=Anthostomella pinea TaxID=933095 RepID=A0AAI8YM60_9PEZI|nr:Uu.00g057720.m01.CDS01 [Anthostomella pinea]